MQRFSAFDLSELRLTYRVLHAHLMEHSELMDTAFFEELQRWLQYRAGQDGVDVGDHQAWDRWLGNEEVSCEARMANRQVLQVVD